MAFTTRSLFCIASSSSQLSSESSSRSTCSASSWLWPVRFPQHLGHCYAGRLLLLLFALSILDESSFEREREIIGYVFIGLVLGFFVAICLLIFISRVRQCGKSKKKPKIKAQQFILRGRQNRSWAKLCLASVCFRRHQLPHYEWARAAQVTLILGRTEDRTD